MNDNGATSLRTITTLDMRPSQVLSGALGAGLSEVLVLGWDHNGDLYFSSSSANGEDVIWLIEKAKKMLLEVGDNL